MILAKPDRRFRRTRIFNVAGKVLAVSHYEGGKGAGIQEYYH